MPVEVELGKLKMGSRDLVSKVAIGVSVRRHHADSTLHTTTLMPGDNINVISLSLTLLIQIIWEQYRLNVYADNQPEQICTSHKSSLTHSEYHPQTPRKIYVACLRLAL
jgi:hypothetical protein